MEDERDPSQTDQPDFEKYAFIEASAILESMIDKAMKKYKQSRESAIESIKKEGTLEEDYLKENIFSYFDYEQSKK